MRCGAHSTPGYSSCDDGIVIDLRAMNGVEVDPGRQTARVQGGAIWAELDAATQEHGLAVTGGRVSDTGVGGLALGSGSGWLERMYGVTCESLISAEVVTADGRLVTASAEENPDLFWGLRGGGGNFGVVTEFEFRLHPVGPLIAAGLLLYPRAQAGEVIRYYRDFLAGAPDEVGGGVALLTAPPEPFVPEELRGQPAVGVVYCYIGRSRAGHGGGGAAARVRRAGHRHDPADALHGPAADARRRQPARGARVLQGRLAARSLRRGDRHRRRPRGGAAGPVRPAHPGADGRRARPHRPRTRWRSRSTTASGCTSAWPCGWTRPRTRRNIAWTRGFHEAMRPFGVGTALPNFIEPDEGTARLRASYGEDKYARLLALKQRWDPDNMFRLNQNIVPSSG